MEQVISEIWQSIKILNDHSGQMAVDIGILKAQMSMVLKFNWAVLLIVIGFIISKVLAKTFNNKK